MHNLIWQPGAVPHHPHSEQFLPYVQSKSTSFRIKLLPLVLSLQILVKSFSPSFSNALLLY